MNFISAVGLNHLPYSVPLHPVLVHFTIALIVVAILADVIGFIVSRWKIAQSSFEPEPKYSSFSDLGWWNLLVATILTFFTVIIGVYELLKVEAQPEDTSRWSLSAQSTLYLHGVIGLILFFLIVLLTIWRSKQYYRSPSSKLQPASRSYLAVSILILGVVSIQGLLGGHLANDFAIHNTAVTALHQPNDQVSIDLIQLRANVRDPLAPNPPSLAKSRTIQESIAFTPLNLPDPKFNQVEQTLYYGVQPLFYLPRRTDWSSLLTHLNERRWSANQFQLEHSENVATIVLNRHPLLSVEPSIAEQWLHKLQQALL
ncbi:MAG: DUF2231 domain-containing protein [Leptolyngbya sp. BL-A-14]